MKKINFIYYLMFIALLAVSCQDEEYEPINYFSDVGWLNSEDDKKGLNTEVGKYHSFSDMSQGTLEHYWTFPEGSDVNWLKGNITRQDTNFTKFIVDTDDTLSRDQTVHILFNKEGEYPIRLYNEFRDSVFYNGEANYPSYYNEEKGVYVIDTTFTVRVYGEMSPAYEIWHVTEEGVLSSLVMDFPVDSVFDAEDTETWQVFEFEAGGYIRYIDKTWDEGIGWPNQTNWNIGGIVPSEVIGQKQYDAKYFAPGDYTSQITIIRDPKDEGAFIKGSKESIIPLVFRVTPSTKPFGVSGNGIEREDQTIQIALTSFAQEFEGLENDFVVTVKNENHEGWSTTIPVSKAKLNDEQKVLIELTLAQPIYNTDIITVSYTGNSILAIDNRVLETFTDLPVDMHIVNLMADKSIYGFESGEFHEAGRPDQPINGWNMGWQQWNLYRNGNSSAITGLSSAGEPTFEGDFSLRLEANGHQSIAGDANSERSWAESPINLPLELGKNYKFEFEYLYETSNEAPDAKLWLGISSWGAPQIIDINVAPADEWQHHVAEFTIGSLLEHQNVFMRFDNGTSPAYVKALIFLDNFEMKEYERRPDTEL